MYSERLQYQDWTNIERQVQMNKINPKYILRNYMAHIAIEELQQDNHTLFETFFELIKRPYDEQPEFEKWYAKQPNWAKDTPGCSQLSCSS